MGKDCEIMNVSKDDRIMGDVVREQLNGVSVLWRFVVE
jgi:hypothetical protein